MLNSMVLEKDTVTVDAIETLVGNVLDCFEKDMFCLAIFIDLKKAFDTVKHSVILGKLERIGIQGTALDWFESYLDSRKQFIEDGNGTKSKESTLLTGVPQGSLLGVLLFQLIINDMKNCLKYSNAILYADDTTLYVIGNKIEFLELKLQADMNAISMWLKSNSLCLNEKKTKIVLFSRPGRVNFVTPHIIVNNFRIVVVESFKFLGLSLDNHLSWNVHYENLSKKLSQSLFVLNRVKNLIPQRCMRMLYYAYFDSHLGYAMPVWFSPLSQTKKECLYKLQKRAVRIVNNRYYRAHTDPLFKTSRILKLADKSTVELCKLLYKVQNNQCPLPVCNLFQSNQHNVTRSGGLLIAPHTSKIYNDSFLCKGVVAWNKLKPHLKEKKSLKAFARHLKRELF